MPVIFRRVRALRVTTLALLALLVLAAPLVAQDTPVVSGAPGSTGTAGGRKVLTLDDYGSWNRIGAAALSGDGRWMTYSYTPLDGSGTLYIRLVDGEKVHTIPSGSGALFSDDSKWIAYQITPSTGGRGTGSGGGAGGGGARGAQPAAGGVGVRRLQLLELGTGTTTDYPGISSFRFSPDSRYLLMKKGGGSSEAASGRGATQAPADQGGRGQGSSQNLAPSGTDLVIRNLFNGELRNLGNVTQFAMNRDGKLLAYFIDAADRLGNGLYIMNMATGVSTPVDATAGKYEQLTWSEDGSAIAALRGERSGGKLLAENTLILVRNAGSGNQRKVELNTAGIAGFPQDFVISEFSALTWSKDATRIFFGIKQQEAEPERSSEPRANVDVWHWKDTEPQSVQMVRLNAARRATHQAVYDLEGGRFLRLVDDVMRSVALTADSRWGIGRVDSAYRYEITWGGAPADYYRVNLATGERTLIAPRLTRTLGTSPDSRWFAYLERGSVYAVNLESLEKLDLSRIAGVNFVDEEDDHPYEKPTFGVAGWSRDGRSVLLNHKHDIYSVPLTAAGKTVNITNSVGAADQIRFRIVRLERDGDGSIDTNKPIILSAAGEWSKQSGYWRLDPGGRMQPLLFEDASISGLTKAEKADRVIFNRQTFSEFGDYWVSGSNLAGARRITDANPQLGEYAWGSKVLIDYANSRGQRLQGTLTLPAGYEPGKRYPMLVYFYEKMSDQHHRFSMPAFDDRPHMSAYASDGYLVLQPDVVYETGKPGTSALDCVSAAVKKVIELGYADPDRIGLQGHSWGGYESSFIVTQTDMFAAVVTGAPVTNLVSFYGELYKSTGTVQQGIMERGQVRMGVGYFENKELYESQSPLHHAENIKTPFLILHGTDDGAVDWHQGLEFFNAAKRLGKQVILLSYPGEAHHLGRRENQRDFQVRMKQFFDHYLKGTDMPEWMADGVDQVRKGG